MKDAGIRILVNLIPLMVGFVFVIKLLKSDDSNISVGIVDERGSISPKLKS